MKYKHEVVDSSGSSKSPSKGATKNRTPSKHTLTGDGEVPRSVKFQLTEGPSLQERLNETEGNENSTSQNEQNEVSIVESNKTKSSPGKSVKSIFSIEELSPDDEIYTLQCPQNYNKLDLVDKNLDFTKLESALTVKGEVFQVQLLNSDKKFITLAVPKETSGGSLVKLPLKGHIVIQKSVDIFAVEPMDDDNSEKDAVKFPDDIKVRHPLLGYDWKAHVDLADAAFMRNSSFSKKSKKRKKEKVEDDDIVEIKKIKEEMSESEISSPRKKKKRHDS